MKLELASVGSVSLWAKVEWPTKQPTLKLWMESRLAGASREIGFLLTLDDIPPFVEKVHSLLRALK